MVKQVDDFPMLKQSNIKFGIFIGIDLHMLRLFMRAIQKLKLIIVGHFKKQQIS